VRKVSVVMSEKTKTNESEESREAVEKRELLKGIAMRLSWEVGVPEWKKVLYLAVRGRRL
jgi:hypothetical protein